MAIAKKSTAERARHRMPASVRSALAEADLLDAYRARPPYQRNDYVGWIVGAKQDATKQKRIKQMLTELRGGKKYMNMAWSPDR